MNRHVLIRPFNRGPMRQGLVVAWRQAQRNASPPHWEALVLTVHDLDASTRADWIPSVYLVPVESLAPWSGNDESAPDR